MLAGHLRSRIGASLTRMEHLHQMEEEDVVALLEEKEESGCTGSQAECRLLMLSQ